MTDNDVITTVLNQGDLLAEILCDYEKRSLIRITGKLHRGQIRAIVEFAPEILAEHVMSPSADKWFD